MSCADGVLGFGCCEDTPLGRTVFLLANSYIIGFQAASPFDLPVSERVESYFWSLTYDNGGGTVSGSVTLPPIVRRKTDAPTVTIVDNTDPAKVAQFMQYYPGNVIGRTLSYDPATRTRVSVQSASPDPNVSRTLTDRLSGGFISADKPAIKTTLLAQKFSDVAGYKNAHILDKNGGLDDGFPTDTGFVYPLVGSGLYSDRLSQWQENSGNQTVSGLPGGGTHAINWQSWFTAVNGDYAGYVAALAKHKPAITNVQISIFWRYMFLTLYRNLPNDPICRTMSTAGVIGFCQGGNRADSILVDLACTSLYNVGETGQVYTPTDASKPPCCNIAP
jgi:hypothetical protein